MAYLPPKMYVCLEHVLGRYAPFIPSERTGPQTFFSLGVVSEESAVASLLYVMRTFWTGNELSAVNYQLCRGLLGGLLYYLFCKERGLRTERHAGSILGIVTAKSHLSIVTRSLYSCYRVSGGGRRWRNFGFAISNLN